jgi:hypothetical protein
MTKYYSETVLSSEFPVGESREMRMFNHPTLRSYAHVIEHDWCEKVSPHARPYLDAMHELQGIDDTYWADSGRSVVAYFLANARGWRGNTAKRVKLELNKIIKSGAYQGDTITEDYWDER